MAVARKVATVFGGSGFIGRYVVKRLAADGYTVRVAARRTDRALFLKPMGGVGQIVLLHAPITDEASVTRAIDGASIVVNLVGILAERRRGDFTRIHVEDATRVARLAAAAGVERLVHFSAIGADPGSASAYGASKGRAEVSVRAVFPRATILRPSIVFGPEDSFFNRFATMAQMLPFMPVISGTTKFQPVYVGDVADAVMAVLAQPGAAGSTYELGGPQVMSMREILVWILRETEYARRLVGVPMGLARLQAFFLERLPGRLLTRDQLTMLARDNLAAPDVPGLAALDIVPTPIDLVVPAYLRRFRAGGGRRHIAGEPA
ncbi:MAG: complex I NDUFA9 subunit family protein [Acetobacteraceae bacterium]|nr:complex I NDUFA9 subunit family protein [Acetobacteraceae bacterium]MSP29807.1 complex I NDUFA9 subunit family protein [Acetobacteraceae bacterium]